MSGPSSSSASLCFLCLFLLLSSCPGSAVLPAVVPGVASGASLAATGGGPVGPFVGDAVQLAMFHTLESLEAMAQGAVQQTFVGAVVHNLSDGLDDLSALLSWAGKRTKHAVLLSLLREHMCRQQNNAAEDCDADAPLQQAEDVCLAAAANEQFSHLPIVQRLHQVKTQPQAVGAQKHPHTAQAKPQDMQQQQQPPNDDMLCCELRRISQTIDSAFITMACFSAPLALSLILCVATCAPVLGQTVLSLMVYVLSNGDSHWTTHRRLPWGNARARTLDTRTCLAGW